MSITPEEGQAFLDLFKENTTPLTAYSLSSAQGRRDFLWRFSEKGEEALFEAVQAVWTQLAEPKSYRCWKIAKAAGLSGSGKKALMAALAAFLDEFNSIETMPLRDRADYPSLEAWHAAVSEDLAVENAKATVVLVKYEAVLDGRKRSSR